ncbi:hypothetical protein amrb99_97780 [Actinomadura sp. RB99]|uniref:hypothetical protein n=1 Tax=Actinomadura sp. RB99 TaxID=2691577 RepID=UPI0019CE5603|nr:hypothetical protein [Actinomadura sp. RB99]MBD2900769.1 hypothetical protein [Actinomadura sp. RB99]
MPAPSAGRKGRRWRRARAEILSTSTVCWLCGHDGAGDADHEPPLAELLALGLDPDDPAHLRPAHGAYSRCPTCGQCCNQVKGKGDRPRVARPSTSRDW